MVCHAEQYSVPLVRNLASSEWPWWLHRLCSYVSIVKSVHERASIGKVDPPPRYMWWDSDELEKYFEERK